MMGYEQQQSRGFCDKEDEEEDDEELITRPVNTSRIIPSASSSNNFSASPNFIENNYWAMKSFDSEPSPHQNSAKSHDPTDSTTQQSKSMAVVSIEREHMFDKVVTPSDVGKLNRLVIPKQHAEKFFPLDSSSNEKGLLLNFEDRNGKPWRFRYSYWNSSQSYVMTKGWSRFVKEKQLDAGDIVSFQRGVGELGKDKLFIDWQRRPNAPPRTASFLQFPSPPIRWRVPIIQKWNFNSTHHPYYSGPAGSLYRLRSSSSSSPLTQIGGTHLQNGILRDGVADYSVVIDSVPIVRGKSAAKRLRLFGVNMECPINEESECNILSSTAVYPHHHRLPSFSFPHLHQFNETYSKPEIHEGGILEKGKCSLSLDLDL